MKILKWFLVGFAVLVVGVVVFVGYMFMQLSNPKQKDLGVKYTMADYDRVVKEKAKVEVPVPSDLCLGSVFATEGAQKVDLTLTDAEVSAIQNYSNSVKGPINNVQIKFLGGKSAEASFTTNFTYQGRKINYPIYVRGQVESTGPKSFGLNVEKLQAGSLPVPGFVVDQAKTEFTKYLNGILSGINALNVEKAEILAGSVHFVGTIPTKAYGL